MIYILGNGEKKKKKRLCREQCETYSLLQLDHTIQCFSSFYSSFMCIICNDCMPLFREFRVCVKIDKTLIVFSFCQHITFYIKKHSCQLISWVQGTLWQLLLLSFYLVLRSPLINGKRKKAICGLQKMYLISRQLWDGSVATRLGS